MGQQTSPTKSIDFFGNSFFSMKLNKLVTKTAAVQLSVSPTPDFIGFCFSESLVFRRLAIVNPTTPYKFILLFK